LDGQRAVCFKTAIGNTDMVATPNYVNMRFDRLVDTESATSFGQRPMCHNHRRQQCDNGTAGIWEWTSRNEHCRRRIPMKKRTIEQLEAALRAVSNDLAPRVEELAQKSTEGVLTPEEHREYAKVVRLNDMLSLLKLETEEFWTMRAVS
jgi:hypothetical protein